MILAIQISRFQDYDSQLILVRFSALLSNVKNLRLLEEAEESEFCCFSFAEFLLSLLDFLFWIQLLQKYHTLIETLSQRLESMAFHYFLQEYMISVLYQHHIILLDVPKQ